MTEMRSFAPTCLLPLGWDVSTCCAAQNLVQNGRGCYAGMRRIFYIFFMNLLFDE